MIKFEQILWNQKATYIAGVDEVGRGALAGPVIAAAVIFPSHTIISEIADSKTLNQQARHHCLKKICNSAIDLGIGAATPQEIDELNILHASLLAMRRAIDTLERTPNVVFVDGNRPIPDLCYPQLTLIKGDQRSQSIAGASIVAKVIRDHLLKKLHQEFPAYGWNQNVGYPTKSHYSTLEKFGPTIHHRRSFRLQ
ncbi:MAG: ribonuclease HII [Bacteroidetes bacterium]|nr:ribonuclease HII [Bacteroidota bacterium]MCY4232511.1 ribonuclease HII [Bacteroidota bacterium]